MTKKAHQKLFAPRPATKPQPGGKGHHQVDSEPLILCAECAERDLDRRKRRLPPLNTCHHQIVVDDPGQHPSQAPIMLTALALIEVALSREDASTPIYMGSPDDGQAILAIFLKAGLSSQEARAWELYCAGFGYREISAYMDRQAGEEPLSISSIRTYLDRGREKLRKVQNP